MRRAAKRASIWASPTRGARSEGHNAVLAGLLLAASSGRISVVHSARASPTQGQTVSTLRRFGAEPFMALPWRT